MGGLARRATLINEWRSNNPNTLVLDGGNTFWGNSGLGMQSQGKVIVDAMNLMGYNAMALGETDLQLGESVLRQRMAEARFPVLSANVIIEATGKLFTRPYVLLELAGRKVGIIGLTGSGSVPATSVNPQSSTGTGPAPAPSPLTGPPSPTPAEGAAQSLPAGKHVIGSLAVVDAEAALRSTVKELQTQTNAIIVLSNVGWDANLHLAEAVPGIALIISAGPGQVLTQPWQSPRTGTLVCQVGVYPQAHPGQLLANVKMHIDSTGMVREHLGDEAVLDDTYADDAQIRKLLDDYQLKQ
jgi:2',3'-cyclic-nucleotide 2'-phosphodiesterase (5'-nucleotidase family)